MNDKKIEDFLIIKDYFKLVDKKILKFDETKDEEKCKFCKKYISLEFIFYDEKSNSYICKKCLPKICGQSIFRKLENYELFDLEKFGRKGTISENDIIELFFKQKFLCYICDEPFLIYNWRKYCLYQFSVDRINDFKPHDRENCLISCFYCNCRVNKNFNKFNDRIKKCNDHIHKKINENILWKHEISKEKINKLLL